MVSDVCLETVSDVFSLVSDVFENSERSLWLIVSGLFIFIIFPSPYVYNAANDQEAGKK